MSATGSALLVEKHLAFKFKGTRKYVHGTDIYKSIVESLGTGTPPPLPGKLTQFRLAFHKPSHNHCHLRCQPLSSSRAKPEHAVVEFQFSCNENAYVGWLCDTGEPVRDHYDHEEEKLVSQCIIDDRRVSVERFAEHSVVENLVTMTRHLHLSVFPDAQGKWFFSRLDLPALLPEKIGMPLAVELKHTLGQRLTRSTILIDNEPAGSICFSLVPA